MATSVRFDAAAYDRIRARVEARIADAMASQARTEAEAVVETTLEQWPVATGESARGWRDGLDSANVTTSDGGLTVNVRIENDVAHAAVVEYGDSDTPPGGHLQRALREARSDVPARLQKLVRRSWGGG